MGHSRILRLPSSRRVRQLDWDRVRRAMREGLHDRRAERPRVEWPCRGQESEVREIFYPGVRARPRHRERVELLGDVRLARIGPHRDRWDARRTRRRRSRGGSRAGRPWARRTRRRGRSERRRSCRPARPRLENAVRHRRDLRSRSWGWSGSGSTVKLKKSASSARRPASTSSSRRRLDGPIRRRSRSRVMRTRDKRNVSTTPPLTIMRSPNVAKRRARNRSKTQRCRKRTSSPPPRSARRFNCASSACLKSRAVAYRRAVTPPPHARRAGDRRA